jgi:hypothetical protein
MTANPPTGAYAALPFPCCDHCGCQPWEREGHDDSCRRDCHLAQGICGCGNRFTDDNLCMLSACQDER